MKFALIGAAGYVAPRHMRAILDVGGDLVACLDPHDSVGVLDSLAPGCLYFREPERFERWLIKHPVDYVSVCSPNYLHDSHCIMAMRAGADVICEKPLVCHERNLDTLLMIEEQTGKRVNVVLQCRLHPAALAARDFLALAGRPLWAEVQYVTPRGPWYLYSWKGEVEKSGGLATNIGIHLFDLLVWLFGAPKGRVVVVNNEATKVNGYIQLEDCKAHWSLSVNGERSRAFRFMPQDGKEAYEIDLTSGFETLHSELYRKVLAGAGYGIEDIRPATRIAEEIRQCQLKM